MNAKQAREHLEEYEDLNSNPHKQYLKEIEEQVRARCRLLHNTCHYYFPLNEMDYTGEVSRTMACLQDLGYEVKHVYVEMAHPCMGFGIVKQPTVEISW